MDYDALSAETGKDFNDAGLPATVIKSIGGHEAAGSVRFRRELLGFALILVIAGCAAQQSGQVSANPQSPAAGASDSSIVSRSDCSVDLKKVCQAEIDRPEIIVNNDKFDWVSFTQNFPPHTHVYYTLILPNGHAGAAADCYIATERRRVLNASLMPQPPLTDEAVQYVKSIGGCEEQHPDYAKMIEEFEKNDHIKPAVR